MLSGCKSTTFSSTDQTFGNFFTLSFNFLVAVKTTRRDHCPTLPPPSANAMPTVEPKSHGDAKLWFKLKQVVV